MLPTAKPLPRARSGAALGAVLALGLLAGCGGPSGSPDGPASPTPAPTASAVEVSPDATTTPDGDDASASPDATPSVDPAACAALQDAWNTTNQALVNLSSEHPRNLVNSFRMAGEAMDDVEALDPVADDWAKMTAYLRKVNRALEDVDANDADAVATALNDTITADDTQEVTDAGGRITDFLAADCVAP